MCDASELARNAFLIETKRLREMLKFRGVFAFLVSQARRNGDDEPRDARDDGSALRVWPRALRRLHVSPSGVPSLGPAYCAPRSDEDVDVLRKQCPNLTRIRIEKFSMTLSARHFNKIGDACTRLRWLSLRTCRVDLTSFLPLLPNLTALRESKPKEELANFRDSDITFVHTQREDRHLWSLFRTSLSFSDQNDVPQNWTATP